MRFADISRYDKETLILELCALDMDDISKYRPAILERAEDLGCLQEVEEAIVTACAAAMKMGGWSEPDAITPPPPPSFNPEWLPGVYGRFAAELKEFYQVPPDLPGALILGAVSAAMLGLYKIYSPWREPLQLYTCVSMNPSERKSPVFSAVRAPIDEYVREENIRRRPLIEQYKVKRDTLARTLERKKHAGDVQGAVEAAAELGALQEVKPLTLVVSDATVEATQMLVSDNGGRLAIMDAEGDVFDIMTGRYSNGNANLGIYLHGYSDEPVVTARVGRETPPIPSVSIAMVLAVQPGVVQQAFSNSVLRERGALARFLWVQPVSMTGKRRIRGVHPVNADTELEYADKIRRLLARERPEKPHPMTLTAEAKEAFTRWREEVESRREGDLAELDVWGWGGKLEGLTLRIAATLAVMADRLDIDADTLLTAVEVSRWAIAHAQTVSFGTVSEKSAAMILLDRIISRVCESISRRAMRRLVQNRSAFRTCGAVDDFKLSAAMGELEARGYIRRAEDQSGKSEIWLVNPHALPKAAEGRKEVTL